MRMRRLMWTSTLHRSAPSGKHGFRRSSRLSSPADSALQGRAGTWVAGAAAVGTGTPAVSDADANPAPRASRPSAAWHHAGLRPRAPSCCRSRSRTAGNGSRERSRRRQGSVPRWRRLGPIRARHRPGPALRTGSAATAPRRSSCGCSHGYADCRGCGQPSVVIRHRLLAPGPLRLFPADHGNG